MPRSKPGPPGPPARDFGYSLGWLRTSPGARKERLRQRPEPPETLPTGPPANELTVKRRTAPQPPGAALPAPESEAGRSFPRLPAGRLPPTEPVDERWPGARLRPTTAPAIDFRGLAGDQSPGYLSPGARKEQLRRRPRDGPRRRPGTGLPELRAASAFSFLDGASLPEDLAQRAAELEIPAVALLDRNGVYGAPRFHQAAQRAGLKAIVGAEISLSGGGRTPGSSPLSRPRLSLVVAERRGYRNLCRLLSAAARGRPKGEARASQELLDEHAAGLWCLTGGPEGAVGQALEAGGLAAARALLERLARTFEGRLAVEIQRHRQRDEEHRNRALVELASRLRLPLVATNGVRYARAGDKPLYDVLTCIREHTRLDAAGRLLAAQRERHFKSGGEMAGLFADLPAALAGTRELAERLEFTLADLGYRFPDYPLPPGETTISYLRQVVWNSAPGRFRPLSARAQSQLERELAMIDKLDLAGYFLIVWDIIRFCQRRGILAQGRGSAANSAVCYALSITAVDPVRMELLFERFLSEERGEWPDIDLDLPSGERREEVIQYVYRRYGPHGAAMTANVITYRDRSAAREVAKALGYNPEQVDKLARRLGRWHYDTSRGDPKSMPEELAAAGFDPQASRIRLFAEMWQRIQNLPRHLGQHSGGMVIAAGRLDEVVPLEPAAMEDRVVVQWDKDDCADLGIIKVDLLGLGMLQALEEAIPMIRDREGVSIDLAHIPPDDPRTYRMLRAADTVGVFQVESRAQMASLPRNAPRRFYDLVIQVAIIRPGPIVGGMVHPYFERRRGRQSVEYPHPSLEPILARTLGVLLFQEQILRVAMTAAGFSGGEAEELRRAMGFKRSAERMAALEQKLRRGMAERGITGAAQEQIVHAITSFALYGFPESHAASFALIAYASAYLKAHHPTAFLISLLNAWPMGFYHPATLVKDAQRHGVEVLPVDVNHSGWRCRWEERSADPEQPERRQRPRMPAIRGGSLSERVAAAPNAPLAAGAGSDARRRDAGDVVSSSRSGNAAAGSTLNAPLAAGAGSDARRRDAGDVVSSSRSGNAAAGSTLNAPLAAGAGSDARRRDAGDVVSSSRSGNAAAGSTLNAPLAAGAGSDARRRDAGDVVSSSRSGNAAAGSTLNAPLAAGAGSDARRRDAGDVVSSSRSGNAAAGPAPAASGGVAGAARLGLHFVRGLSHPSGQIIERQQARHPFSNVDDLVRRCRLRRGELEVLAGIGALGSLGLTRRQALWQAARAVRPAGPLLATASEDGRASPLGEMSEYEATLADYGGTGLTTGRHPLAHLRRALQRHGVLTAAQLDDTGHGARVRTAGAVIVRQRPGTAKGILFITLEDETGMSQAIVSANLMQRNRELIVGAGGLIVEGVLQKRDGTLSLKAERLWRLSDLATAPSHDFR